METNLGMNNFLSLLVLGLFIGTTHSNNVSVAEELRQPRVSGRIVKLYSGTKPEPILCAGEGFQADPEDCAVFYRCMKGANNKYTVFRYQCGPGTVYDPDNEICNHPRSTKRINCGGFVASTREAFNENEIDGSRQEIPFPISTKQPVYTEKTPKIDASTQLSQKLWSTTDYKMYTSSTSRGDSRMVTGKQNIRATRSPMLSQPNSQSGETCTSDGFMGDSENCRKFYRCVGNGRGGYIRYEFSCSESTIWDDEAQACNHAWAVKKRRCGGGYPDDDAKSSQSSDEDNEINSKETIQSQLQISYGSKVNQVQTQISKGQVVQNQTQINYGDKIKDKSNSNGKQNQTQISHGSAVSQTQTQISHGNKGSQTQLQIDHSKEASQSQTQIHETDTSQTDTSSQNDETQNPNVNECTESGFIGDTDDCKKFYRCVDNGRGGYIKYEFACGEGTVWDPNVEACNHEWAVKDCKNKTPSDQNSKPTSTTNSPSTEEKPADEDEDAGYGSQNQQPSQTSTASESKPSTTTETSKTTPTTQGTNISSSTSSSSDSICTTSGFMGDNEDCTKFYRCVDNGKDGYTRYEFSCGEGTVWDSEIEACNHVWAVKKCGKSTPDKNTSETTTNVNNIMQNEESDVGYPSQSDSNEDKPTDLTTASTTSTTTSPTHGDTCNSSGFMGDKYDCKKFYRCVDDGKGGYIRYEFSCGEGTVWDQSIEACNHPSKDQSCTASQTVTQETDNESTTQSSSTAQSINGDNGDSDESTTKASTEKPAFTAEQGQQQSTSNDICESEGFYASSADCKKFYRCVDNGKGSYTKYDFTCGDGTVWDQQTQTCNHGSSQNKCSGTSITNESEHPESGTEATKEPDVSNDYTTSSTTTTTTKLPSNENNDQCTSEGFYANSKDCKKFYRCVANDKGGFTKYDFTCGDGTIWVQEIQACDHDNNDSNCSSQTADSTPSSQNEQDEQSTTKATTTAQSTENGTDGTTNDCSNNSTQSNECKSEGFYANKNDCRKFYRCVDNGQGGYTKYDFTCGEGTAWDPEINSCNHVNAVKNCQGAPETNQSEQGSTDDNSSQSTEATSTTKTSTTEASNENNQPPSPNDKCEKEGYFGDSNNCQNFYRCVDNGNGGLTKYDFTCGEGTIWDQDLQTCNHPGDVQNPSCSNNTTASTTSTETSSGTSSTNSGSSSTSSDLSSSTTESQGSSDCSQGSTQKPQKSQVNCTKAGFYADPNDCKKFYRCVDWDNNGERFSVYHFDCGEGTIWDPELETCNHENAVYPPRDCSGTQSTDESTTTTTTTTTQKSTTENATTTEELTTQQSTTESSTTEEPTTTEATTTEQSTTQKSTTTEKSTTQQSTTTTTEQSTTEQSSTTEKSTTTEKTTTEQSTTQQSSTTEQTTESTTTEQSSTTEQSTTEQSSTTQESSTEENTTQQSTTQQDDTTTTEQSTTESTSDQTSTTQESTTQESSSSAQTTDSLDSSTTEQSSDGTTTEDNQESTTESSSSGSKECPETEDDQYLYVCPTSFKRHPKYCNMFYQCTEDNDSHDLDIAVFKCPNNTIYDESKTQCVEEDKADKKCDGEKAERRRVKRLGATFKEPIVVSKETLACPSTGHFPFEKSECSPAFLKCDRTKSGKLRGFVNQCPEGYVYWSISRRCEAKHKVRDCKLTANDWRGRWEIPIERGNIAK